MKYLNKNNSFFLWSKRFSKAIFLSGEILIHLKKNKIYKINLIEQLNKVGIQSLSICLITACFVGMVFTIQVAKEFIYFEATSALGGVLSLALSRELSPVLTSVIIAGRIGSAFTAEIATMQVTEQIDALYILKTNPLDYLVIPRILACASMLPILSLLSFLTGLASSLLVSALFYNINPNIFINSSQYALTLWDILSGLIKSIVFGILIALISCSWGLTTKGGAKNVGESTTMAVVTSLLFIFTVDFLLSYLMYNNVGSAMSRIL
uniref:MlaE family lipid ABC transporter permease subunit n=1 Tax=Sciadococcus taiwanensis TaxID=3028030 RepID=A0A9Y1I297_9RHOD|nr:MlaE family lipid ABC transporter permease subunit [Sciadococcus taiwanensis]